MNEVIANESFFNSLDYIYIVLMFLSTLSGFVRGFTKSILSLCAWIGSGFIAGAVAPLFYPIIYGHISNHKIAHSTSVIFSYILVLVILLIVSNLISQEVRSSKLSGVDRSIGALFGLLRSILSLFLAILFIAIFEIPLEEYPLAVESKITNFMYAITQELMPSLNKSGIISHLRDNRDRVREMQERLPTVEHSQQEQVNMSRVKIITVDKRTRTQQQLKNRSPIKVINGNNISKKPIKMRMKRLHNISSILNSKQSASIKR